MPFLNDLNVSSIRGTSRYKLTSPLCYDHFGNIYTAKSGFETDFASIPNLFRNIIDEDEGDIRDAAVIHDWLYTTREVQRDVADKVLRDAMIDLGAPIWKVAIVYAGVRMFGWIYFRDDEQNQASRSARLKGVEENL